MKSGNDAALSNMGRCIHRPILFPLDRLRELEEESTIGSVAGFHYSFMGAQDPMKMEDDARSLAGLLKKDNVDAALLVPV